MDVNNKNYGAAFRIGQSAAKGLKGREKKSETAKENAKRGRSHIWRDGREMANGQPR
jgi:hypothetical protein